MGLGGATGVDLAIKAQGCCSPGRYDFRRSRRGIDGAAKPHDSPAVSQLRQVGRCSSHLTRRFLHVMHPVRLRACDFRVVGLTDCSCSTVIIMLWVFFVPGYRVALSRENFLSVYVEKREGRWREFTPEMPESLKRDDEGVSLPAESPRRFHRIPGQLYLSNGIVGRVG